MEYYIKKNDAVNLLMKEAKSHGLSFSAEAYERAANLTACMPNEDVKPVNHGRWSECYTDSRLYSGICSVCGGAAIRGVKGKPLDYCPNCGARMDGET